MNGLFGGDPWWVFLTKWQLTKLLGLGQAETH